MGIDGTASIGFWKQPFETGGTQGATTSVSGVVSISGGVWYTDFDPEAKAQEERAGFTFSAGIGLGVEYGEYHEVGTKVFGPVPVTLPVICSPGNMARARTSPSCFRRAPKDRITIRPLFECPTCPRASLPRSMTRHHRASGCHRQGMVEFSATCRRWRCRFDRHGTRASLPGSAPKKTLLKY